MPEGRTTGPIIATFTNERAAASACRAMNAMPIVTAGLERIRADHKGTPTGELADVCLGLVGGKVEGAYKNPVFNQFGVYQADYWQDAHTKVSLSNHALRDRRDTLAEALGKAATILAKTADEIEHNKAGLAEQLLEAARHLRRIADGSREVA